MHGLSSFEQKVTGYWDRSNGRREDGKKGRLGRVLGLMVVFTAAAAAVAAAACLISPGGWGMRDGACGMWDVGRRMWNKGWWDCGGI